MRSDARTARCLKCAAQIQPPRSARQRSTTSGRSRKRRMIDESCESTQSSTSRREGDGSTERPSIQEWISRMSGVSSDKIRARILRPPMSTRECARAHWPRIRVE